MNRAQGGTYPPPAAPARAQRHRFPPDTAGQFCL